MGEKTQPTSYSTHDPACDQCRAKKVGCGRERPQCSNCKRFNLSCEWKGHGRRPRSTFQLKCSLDSHEARIAKLEDALERLSSVQNWSSTLQDPSVLLSPEQQSPPTPATSSRGSKSRGNSRSEDSWQRTTLAAGHRTDLLRDNNHNSWSGSILSLKSCLACLHGSLAQAGPGTQVNPQLASSIDTALQQLIKGLEDADDLLNTDARGALALPALSMPVEAAADDMISHLATISPFIQRSEFSGLMRVAHSPEKAGGDYACKVIVNNVMLLTLNARSLRKAAVNSAEPSIWSLDDNAFPPGQAEALHINFLHGCRRLELLSAPTILNLQALISLILVSLEQSSQTTTSMLFSFACHIATLIKKQGESNQNMRHTIATKTHVFEALNRLGKPYSADRACLMPDMSSATAENEHSDSLMSKMSHLASMERSHLELLLDQTTSANDFSGACRDSWSRLEALFHQCISRASGFLQLYEGDYASLQAASLIEIEAKYSYHWNRLLMFWHSPEQQCGVEDAQACTHLLLSLWKSSASLGSTTLLKHLVCIYPPLPALKVIERAVLSDIRVDLNQLQRTKDLLVLLAQVLPASQKFRDLSNVASHLVDSACVRPGSSSPSEGMVEPWSYAPDVLPKGGSGSSSSSGIVSAFGTPAPHFVDMDGGMPSPPDLIHEQPLDSVWPDMAHYDSWPSGDLGATIDMQLG